MMSLDLAVITMPGQEQAEPRISLSIFDAGQWSPHVGRTHRTYKWSSALLGLHPAVLLVPLGLPRHLTVLAPVHDSLR
jgi:hypothetical protein